MIDHSQVKLGKKAARVDTRTLKLSRYFLATLPPPPPSCDFSHSQDEWGVMMNDELGNCTIAAVAHAVQTWTQVINQEITVPDQVVVDYYSRWCGYMRGIDSTDNGGVELDVLNNWRRDTFAGHQLLGYADADPTNLDHVKQAVALFGGVYLGVQLPLSARGKKVWDVAGGSSGLAGSWGGHAIWAPKYDDKGLYCISWGEMYLITWDFVSKKDTNGDAYCDEAHALVSPDFITTSGMAPSGFNLATLLEDVELIAA
jgi:hypothetical protein